MKKIIYFCKHIPLWTEIDEKLQIALIKGGLTEAMILYNTADYDLNKKTVKFIDGKARSKETFYVSGFHPDVVDGEFSPYSFDTLVGPTHNNYHERTCYTRTSSNN